ncbi:hypothetical protein [Flavobacterium sp. HJJ]|nr:hypothetical protein [Flavobacterium sp. HJJ]
MAEEEIKQKVTEVLDLMKGVTFTELRKIIRQVETEAETKAIIS